jgi:Fungal Zn(2)-Cys(6) binuclear cluster domain
VNRLTRTGEPKSPISANRRLFETRGCGDIKSRVVGATSILHWLLPDVIVRAQPLMTGMLSYTSVPVGERSHVQRNSKMVEQITTERTGRTKACTECREQKVRMIRPSASATSLKGWPLQLKCDAHKDYSRPCTRCRKKGITCVIAQKFKKRKRQTYGYLHVPLLLTSIDLGCLSGRPSWS